MICINIHIHLFAIDAVVQTHFTAVPSEDGDILVGDEEGNAGFEFATEYLCRAMQQLEERERKRGEGGQKEMNNKVFSLCKIP